jgi:type IV secretion system protein VirB6
MAESTVFADLYNGFAGTLINGSTAAADALLGAVAPELAAALSLFVIANGTLVFLQRLPWNTAILNCLRAMFVAHLLTVGLYNQYVQTMFLTTIPNWIVGATNGGANGLNVAEQFDKLRSAVDHQAGVLWAATDSESWGRMIADRLSITLAAQWDVVGLWAAFLIDFIAECLMAVVAPIGAVVMLAYLFGATRHWAERWIGKLVALSLLELLVAIEVKITMTQFNAYMGKTEVASGSGADLTTLISNLWAIGWVFLFGAAVMVALPAIAGAIGGGHVSNVVTTHISTAGNAAARALRASAAPVGDAAAGAAAGAARGAGRAATRMRSGGTP